MSKAVDAFMADLIAKNPSEPQFHQAVREVVESVMPIVDATPAYRQAKILERMIEPERVLMFRVPWVDDKGAGAGQPRLPRPVQQRHRPVQGRPALPHAASRWASSSSWASSRPSRTR